VIASFGDALTADLFHGQRTARTRRVPPEVVTVALRRLDMLNAAAKLDDLRVPPGNRLEALKGDLQGHHGIRVNDQWRIVFRWAERGAEDVRFTDYHP
jgi:proteic killer suppression protein